MNMARESFKNGLNGLLTVSYFSSVGPFFGQQISTAVKQTYCANCDKSIKFSTVILFIIKFIFRYGSILDLTCDDLERSMTLDDENLPFSANCNNTMTIFSI